MSRAEIVTRRARELSASEWVRLQEIGVKAGEAAMRGTVDVAAYMGANDHAARLDFIWSHQNPNNDVRSPQKGRFNKNQAFYGPRVSLATVGKEVVGWAYASWHNVSGGGSPEGPHDTSLLARGKRAARLLLPSLSTPHAPQHDFVHLREVYVNPDHQGEGIGTELLLAVTPDTNRPSRAYTYRGSYKEGHDPAAWFEGRGYEPLRNPVPKSVPGLGDTQLQVMEAAPLRVARTVMQARLQDAV